MGKPPQNNSRGLSELLSWTHPHTRSVMHPNSMDIEVPPLETSQTSLYVALHLAVLLHFYHILY